MPRPSLLCVCPTYGRPRLVANAVACFLAQDYPQDLSHLLILDDAGQYKPQAGPNWEIISKPDRFPSLPAKYRWMFGAAGVLPYNKLSRRWDGVVVWDDDDIYLPNHLSSHGEQLEAYDWSYPQTVYKLDDPARLRTENPDGNMWASIAFRSSYLRQIGWHETEQASFDLQFLGLLRGGGIHGSSPGKKPGRSPNKSFMFRWASTGHPHLQGYIESPTGTTQYSRFPLHDSTYVERLTPNFDQETLYYQSLYRQGQL